MRAELRFLDSPDTGLQTFAPAVGERHRGHQLAAGALRVGEIGMWEFYNYRERETDA